MRVAVNGVRLFVDVLGPGLVPDGAALRERPPLLLLHGGPGFDHSTFRPGFDALGDVVQPIVYDHRGNGRSEDGDEARWTLDQWAEGVKGLCDALGLHRPIVLGVSFGGFVAQAYAARYPDHPGRLILVSTASRVDFAAMFDAFERLGGPAARAVAESYWTAPTPERRAAYFATCVPLYRRTRPDPHALARVTIRHATAIHFNGMANEHGRMDLRPGLARLRCKVLVMAGDDDPMSPPAFAAETMRAIPHGLGRLVRFAGCGHGVFGDRPEAAMGALRAFLAEPSTAGG